MQSGRWKDLCFLDRKGDDASIGACDKEILIAVGSDADVDADPMETLFLPPIVIGVESSLLPEVTGRCLVIFLACYATSSLFGSLRTASCACCLLAFLFLCCIVEARRSRELVLEALGVHPPSFTGVFACVDVEFDHGVKFGDCLSYIPSHR